MSMNLCCDDLDLWQTPTHITFMCMLHKSNPDRLRAYKIWVESTTNGAWNDRQAYEAARARVVEHCKCIDRLINSGKRFKVYYL